MVSTPTTSTTPTYMSVVLNYEGTDVVEELKQMTGGMGPDACIDAVGMESHGASFMGVYDKNVWKKRRKQWR